MNQPLMVIRGNAQLAERRLDRQDKLTAQQLFALINTIERNTKRMSTIINHLRSFSRQSPAEFTPVCVNKVIEDAFLMIGERLRIRGIKVIRNFSPNIPAVNGDINQLEQVFLNLISNASDALEVHEHSHGRQKASKRLIIVTRLQADDHDKIEILFRDNGGGISPNHLNTIFDPFFTTKEARKGTGLGLSISYGIIETHGGKIEVMKTGSKGTTFRIVLPALPVTKKTACPEADHPIEGSGHHEASENCAAGDCKETSPHVRSLVAHRFTGS